ncbi:MAG: vitamin B12 dependent-methionine synthase activation domain-containing protein [Calditrichia bacterium]
MKPVCIARKKISGFKAGSCRNLSANVPENDSSSDQTKSAKKFSEITAVLYVVTIGPGIDNQVKALSEAGEVFEAYILNGIGGAAAEMTALDFNLYVNEELMASRGRGRYRRFSPGYGDWRLEEQQKIFALLKPEDKIGVRLNESNLMIPEKSTSGIMLPAVFAE